MKSARDIFPVPQWEEQHPHQVFGEVTSPTGNDIPTQLLHPLQPALGESPLYRTVNTEH